MKIETSVPLEDGNGIFFHDLEADLLPNLAPHVASVATFVVHRTPFGLDYTVTNLETGLRISRGGSRSAATRRAKERLASKTVEHFEAGYKKAKKKWPILTRTP